MHVLCGDWCVAANYYLGVNSEKLVVFSIFVPLCTYIVLFGKLFHEDIFLEAIETFLE